MKPHLDPQTNLFAGRLPGVPRLRLPTPTEAEKDAQRARQGGKCATCGGVSKGGRRLDVVRGTGGRLAAYCLRHRLEADAGERCHKAAGRRRYRARPRSKPGQRRLGSIA